MKTTDFIKMEDVADVLRLGLETGKNVLLYGPGGHGKSEFVSAWLAERGLKPFTQLFGEGMSEERLFGGVDVKELEASGAVRFLTENSFLGHEVAVFEEMLDAPTSVLLSLKDVLTSRHLRNGAQVVPMTTKFVVACTNRPPEEIRESGPAAAALMERFPLQLEVSWPSYEAGDYAGLFEKMWGDPQWALAELLSSASEFISPRSAVHALHAYRHGGWKALRFVPGLAVGAAEIAEQARKAEEKAEQLSAEARERAEAETGINLLEGRLREVNSNGETSPIKLLQAHKRLVEIRRGLDNLRVPDALVERRNQLADRSGELAKTALEGAVAATRV